jgi:heme exporter protein A
MQAREAVTGDLRPRPAGLALRVEGLCCARGARTLFGPLSFRVEAGEAVAVTGRNGAGKTSLLRLLAGLLRPDSGRIALDGGADDIPLPEQVHYLGHRDAVKPSLGVAENLAFWRSFLGGGGLATEAALAEVGLGHAAGLPAAYLSAGQRRRLSLARLLAVPRPLWLLDEPLSALDAAGQQLAARLMTAHLQNGGLILAATHGPLGIDARDLRIGP